jgi:hypothetical protein
MEEQTWGPVYGFYITAYAAPVGDSGLYCSYAKVCAELPESYWGAECIFKLFAGEHHASAEAALLSAQLTARDTISRIPPGALTLLELGMRSASRQMVHSVGAAIRQRLVV